MEPVTRQLGPSTRVVETGLKAVTRVCVFVYDSVCLTVRTKKTKTDETQIIKLGTGIAHHDTTPTN